MSSSLSPALAHVRNLQTFAFQSLDAWGARIATWLVVGNAGALVIALNAIVNGSSCSAAQITPVMVSFVWGGGLALLGAMTSYVVGQGVIALINKLIEDLNVVEMNEIDLQKIEAQFGPQPDDNALQKSIDEKIEGLKDTPKKLIWLKVVQILVFIPFVASAVCFANGVLHPLTDGGALIASCTPS